MDSLNRGQAAGERPLPSVAPKVSVIVPTFNRPEMLREALASILAQRLRDLEIIVVNDAGPDLASMIAGLGADRPIIYLRHPVNRGIAAARNTGLRTARGRFIAYLDDDDVFYPEHLEQLVALAEAGGHQAVYSDACRATQKKENNGYVIVRRERALSRDFDSFDLLQGNFIPTLCILHERACLDRAGYFDESLTTHEDWDLWIRIGQHFPFAHLPKITCEFRRRDDGSSMTASRRDDFYRTTELIYRRYGFLPGSAPAGETWAQRHARRKAIFAKFRELRKNRSPQARRLAGILQDTLGARWYWAYALRYAVVRPFDNLCRSLRKRFSKASW